jgi:hypothetical protein
MAFAYSTIAGALLPTSSLVPLTSATGVTASNYQGGGTGGSPQANPSIGTVTYLLVEQEMMQIVSLSGTIASVKRGCLGTRAMAHATLTPFTFGLSSDFQNFVPAVKEISPVLPEQSYTGTSAAVVAATSIIASGPLFHVTGATTITNMLPPSSASLGNTGPNSEENCQNGTRVTIIFDSTPAITTGGSGTGPAFAGAVAALTGGTFVDFILDTSSGTQLWYPSRKG